VFAPTLTMGAMKPLIVGFVQHAMDALRTPEMRETIKNSFAKDGRFEKIRSREFLDSCELDAWQDDEERILADVVQLQLDQDGYGVEGGPGDEEAGGEVDEDEAEDQVFNIEIHPDMYNVDDDSDDDDDDDDDDGDDDNGEESEEEEDDV
jgi:hypothetical protein